MWFLVETESGAAGVEIRNAMITDASAALDWTIGMSRKAMRAECARRKWETKEIG